MTKFGTAATVVALSFSVTTCTLQLARSLSTDTLTVCSLGSADNAGQPTITCKTRPIERETDGGTK